MKIVVNALPLVGIRTGIARYVQHLYAELSKHPDVEIRYFDGERLLSRPPEARNGTATFRSLARIFWRLPPRMALWVKMVMHARRERLFRNLASGFDVYHEPAFFPLPVPDGVRTVVTVHDMSLSRYPQWHPRERVLHWQHYFRRLLKRADRVVAVSEFTRRELGEVCGGGLPPVETTLLGVDSDVFSSPLRGDVLSVGSKYGLPEKYVLFVGTGDPRKNVDVIPKALERTGLGIPLVVPGWSGWERREGYSSLLMPLGYVPDEDLPALYAGAVCTVYPSLYEGFGLPVVEAMACGSPVITTRLASMPEVGGDAVCYLENPQDPEELAELLVRLAEDEEFADGLRRRGRERAQGLSWKKTAEQTLKVFHDAVDHPAKNRAGGVL